MVNLQGFTFFCKAFSFSVGPAECMVLDFWRDGAILSVDIDLFDGSAVNMELENVTLFR